MLLGMEDRALERRGLQAAPGAGLTLLGALRG